MSSVSKPGSNKNRFAQVNKAKEDLYNETGLKLDIHCVTGFDTLFEVTMGNFTWESFREFTKYLDKLYLDLPDGVTGHSLFNITPDCKNLPKGNFLSESRKSLEAEYNKGEGLVFIIGLDRKFSIAIDLSNYAVSIMKKLFNFKGATKVNSVGSAMKIIQERRLNGVKDSKLNDISLEGMSHGTVIHLNNKPKK